MATTKRFFHSIQKIYILQEEKMLNLDFSFYFCLSPILCCHTLRKLKARLSPSKKIMFFATMKAPEKTMKSLKALFVLSYLSFFLTFWSCRKIVWVEGYTYFQIFHKVKATREWGLFNWENVRNIFLQKSCTKWIRKTSSRPLFVLLKNLIPSNDLGAWNTKEWLVYYEVDCCGNCCLSTIEGVSFVADL